MEIALLYGLHDTMLQFLVAQVTSKQSLSRHQASERIQHPYNGQSQSPALGLQFADMLLLTFQTAYRLLLLTFHKAKLRLTIF